MEEPDAGDYEEVVDGPVTWRFDRRFLASNWTCIWGRGCLGILDEPAEDLQQGCCSVGAEIDGVDEARRIGALAATLDPTLFQFHEAAATDGCFNAESTNTRLVDDACIFLNRPGFDGGVGCALHLAAVADGEAPMDWKPSVCWQLPIRVEWRGPNGETDIDDETEAGPEVATVRAWSREDWGDEGDTMHWCCTEGNRAYVGEDRVIDSLADEVEALVGTEVFLELRHRLAEPDR